MFTTNRNPGKPSIVLLSTALLLIFGTTVACQPDSSHQAAPTQCPGSPIEPISAPQNGVDEVGIDVTVSTESASLRSSYEAAALADVDQAVSEKETLRLVTFGASGIAAKVVFEGSFAPASDDDVYNLAAKNRASCWAKQAITQALDARSTRSERGTDVAGTLASLVTDARSLTAHGGAASVTVYTDGCQSPSPSGPNRALTDLCGLLTSGESSAQILKTHGAEFSLRDARGAVAIEMKGIGVGRDQDAANTLLGQKLVAFWETVCHRAQARSCQIGSAVS
jgi:hypothetical protein